MLLQRTLTALVLAPLVALAVFKLPSDYFALLWGIFILAAAWEWIKLTGVANVIVKTLFLLALIFAMLSIHYWTVILEIFAELLNTPEIKKQTGLIEWTVLPPVLWWILAMLLLRSAPGELLKLNVKRRYLLLLGFFILSAAWMCLSRMRTFYSPEMTMYFLALIWLADIAAFFAGKKFGKTKLAPEISPGKTVEGVYGSLLAAALFSIVVFAAVGAHYLFILDFLFLSLITVLISIYGDLFISMLKRRAGLKDTGTILPGHGGLLDRIDSVIAAAPLFYGGLYLIYGAV